MNGPNQQTFKVYAFIEVLTCAAGQLIKCIQFVEPLNFYDCSNGVLNFSHSALFLFFFVTTAIAAHLIQMQKVIRVLHVLINVIFYISLQRWSYM